MSTPTRWKCDVCDTEYRSKRLAELCEAQVEKDPEPSVAVGDIVLLRAGFGWYDGERAWISNADKVDPHKQGKPGPTRRAQCPNGDSNCFGECCTFRFYYVVTFMEKERPDIWASNRPRPHSSRWKYHVATLAMKPTSGYHSGYTFDNGHCTPTLARGVPKSVQRESKALIGHKADHLL